MNQPRAFAQKFAVYLYNNNHLDENFSIEKNHARNLFNETFKKEQNTRLSFGTVFFPSLRLLKRKNKNLAIMCYNKNKLLKLIKDEPKIDSVVKTKSPVKKNTVVSHSISFTRKKRSEENVLSCQECKLCDVKFANKDKFEEHLTKAEHIFFEDFNKALKKPNKQPNLQFSINGSSVVNNIIVRKDISQTLQLTVTNTTKQSIKISTLHTKANIAEVTFNPTFPCELAALTNIQWELTVYCRSEGILYFPIIITTETIEHIQQYAIELVFHTHDESLDDLHPIEPYRRLSKPVIKEYIEEVDSGERPNIFPQIPNKVPLKQYLLPVDIVIVLNAGLKQFDGMSSAQRAQMVNMTNLLNVPNKQRCLTSNNYTKLLDMLLYIEEHQMHKDIRDYDKEDQILQRVGHLLELEVPGLAEHRPSVILSDSVFIKENKNSRTLYEGFVHNVKESSVLLKFSKRFMDTVFVNGKKFYVSFTFNRYPLKVEHQAVEFTKVDNISHLLFPKNISESEIDNLELVWFNKDIANNPQQQQAVHSILNKTAMPAPYLIFGPPGTGKTMTVVESVKQIHKRTNQNILICTPSNSAANEVTKRLVNTIPTTDLFRYIAPSFPYSQIPKEIKKYINFPGGNYYLPTMDEFVQYRVVVTTLTSAAKLVNGGCPKKHFSYVFIDESGQATETETLIPIARILTGGTKLGVISGQVVLAGDPKQLGPIIHSTLAKEYGFGTSMLERLMDTCQPYMKDDATKYNPSALTKLLKNYRSHTVIMNQPNQLFYENELETAGDKLINVAVNWEGLPNPQFPLIFHSVVGIDQREKTSPSYFNVQEVQVVLSYLEKLIGCKMQGITIKEEHIGIISPYKKQVEKIKQACRKKKYDDKLLVGTVEQIQGQERLIIIISTVRSKADLLKFDHKFHLGFLDNPKRFNVAITRAKALLIVVGNPNMLQHDKYWRSLISYCKDNNAMAGKKFDFSVSDTQNLEESLLSDVQNMSLLSEADPEDGPNFSRGNN